MSMTAVIPVVLAIAALLVLASVLLPLADRLNLPHVVLIAGLGMVIGLGSLWIESDALEGIVGDAVRGLNSLRLPSEAFLFVFLPILLFTVGLTSEVRRLFDDIAAVLLLAVVAVVVCTVFVGVSLSLVG
ncbi:MAG: hypothetical protein FJX67_00655 [Alphaproteobacteria bacterium]|nr:hypothetical protein [Alphaproteobacteria bacterium]